MSLVKLFCKKILAKLGYCILKNTEQPRVDQGNSFPENLCCKYRDLAFVPFGAGYSNARWLFTNNTLDNPDIMKLFSHIEKLPHGFGIGMDERSVEIPYVFSRLGSEKARLLDAGSSLNHRPLLSRLIKNNKQIVSYTLAPERQNSYDLGISYIFGDLRENAFQSNYFDETVSMSVLEHVGCDNKYFTGSNSDKTNNKNMLEAVKEIRRVTKGGGNVLITVPYGIKMDLGFQMQFDEKLLSKIIETLVPFDRVETVFYRYTSSGWVLATQKECAQCQYVTWFADWMNTQIKPEPTPIEPDFACCARAVACVFIKGLSK